MTFTASIKWECPCGNVNTDQLWTTEEDSCGEDFNNGSVPSDCELNYTEPCKQCKSYELGGEYKENNNSERDFFIAPCKQKYKGE